MRSIRTRILSMTLLCVLASNIIIMFIGIIAVLNTVRGSSDQLIQQLAEKKAQEVDAHLLTVEKSVQNIYGYIISMYRLDGEFWNDPDSLEEALQRLSRLAGLELGNTGGVMAVYYCLAPELELPDAGIYLVLSGEGQYVEQPVQCLNSYAKTDGTSGSMYLEPLKLGEAKWLEPHQNHEADRKVLSYVVPVIYEDAGIGIVGMDIDMDAVRDLVSEVGVYQDVYSIVMDNDGNLVYHPQYPSGVMKAGFDESLERINSNMYRARTNEKVTSYRWNGAKRKIAFRKIRNTMSVGVTVSVSEVQRPAKNVIVYSILIVAAVSGLALVISMGMSKSIVRPLQELTGVAQKLADGELDVKIRCETHDEVEVLANSLQRTADELRKQMETVNEFARTDALTNVHNKAAYQEKVESLTMDIRDGKAGFSVVVLDVNSLKHMNDTYGHEAGDLWITGASTAAERAFGRSRVYRIGGDEFAVILSLNERRHYDRMLAEFRMELDRFNSSPDKTYTEQLQVACGVAHYDRNTDTQYMDVFNRADDAMYENKKMLKGLK